MPTQSDIAIRFSGDSGDGIQVIGKLFTELLARSRYHVVATSEFPAEIRAPIGTVAGISSFQVRFSTREIYTPGEQVDLLVALNPAAFIKNQHRLNSQTVLLTNSDEFTDQNFTKVNLDPKIIQALVTHELPLKSLTRDALNGIVTSPREADRSKNFYLLGYLMQTFKLSEQLAIDWVTAKFKKSESSQRNNIAALRAGYQNSSADFYKFNHKTSQRDAQNIISGKYRLLSGNQAIALGIQTTKVLSRRPVFFAGYPITPASEIMQEVASHVSPGFAMLQAEDEIASIGACIGAAEAGGLAFTATSGPGMLLKTEFINLAVIAELPVVVINVQRAGPSTGMPTQTEQGDLLQAMWGRTGESPLVVLAPATPAECFQLTIEAIRIAAKYMTPVILLSDAYLARRLDVWSIPNETDLPNIDQASHNVGPQEKYLPYKRDPLTLARPWHHAGEEGYSHRTGGMEKLEGTGDISNDPDNHHHMAELRRNKIAGIAREWGKPDWYQQAGSRDLFIGWGSTFGNIREALEKLKDKNYAVDHLHLRHIHPFPDHLGEIFSRYSRIWVIENNLGQLIHILKSQHNVPMNLIHEMRGEPIRVSTIVDLVIASMKGKV